MICQIYGGEHIRNFYETKCKTNVYKCKFVAQKESSLSTKRCLFKIFFFKNVFDINKNTYFSAELNNF